MLVPYFDEKTSPKDDIMNSITDAEREKMKDFAGLRVSFVSRIFNNPTERGPSIVLDDFLFLGNMQHATDRELLERFEISMIFSNIFSYFYYLLLRTYFKRL
jgi:hypothetical protein